jgi:putative transposase
MDQLASLPEADRQFALQRFQVLQPHLEQGRPLLEVARDAGVPYRTAQRWVSLYRKFGLVALARRPRADRGKRRRLSDRLRQVVEGLALQKPPLPITTLYRQVARIAREQGEPEPSYAVVYDVVRELPADLVMLAHEGGKAYGDVYELVHRREADRPNAIWQADHTPLDIELVRDDGKPARPWLTTVIDDYSRAVAGYFLSYEDLCAIQTALALRQAIWRKTDARWHVCGIPDVLYTDNGPDFTSLHLEQVAADLKVRLIFSTPDRPRGRGRIERFFSTVNQMFLAGLPGYAPAGAGQCGKPTLTLAQLDGRLLDFLLDTYHRREHGETKVPPQQRWGQGGFLPRMPESLEQLDLLLLTVPKGRKVHADGIRFSGMRYIDPTLAAFVGEPVTLRYDPRDMAEVRVFHEGRFLCRAICPELAGATVPLRDIVRARSRRRRELRTMLRERQKAVDVLLELKRGGEETPVGGSPEERGQTVPGLRRYLNE